ncbi:jg20574, partial [Pararge aegeria aegeria]
DSDGASNMASETELQEWEPMVTPQPRRARISNHPTVDVFDTLLMRRGGGDAITRGLPIENGVTVLRVLIEGDVDHAVLYPPNEAPQIDLYNQTSVQLFSPASKTSSLSPRDVYLVFPGATLDIDMLSVLPAVMPAVDTSSLVGTWHLSMSCDTCNYTLSVTARTDLHFYVDVEPRDMLKLRVTGPAASVRESYLVDEYGNELAKLAFSYQPVTDNDRNLDGHTDGIYADVPLPKVTAAKVYVKIFGRDVKGNYHRITDSVKKILQQTRKRSFINKPYQILRIFERDVSVYLR